MVLFIVIFACLHSRFILHSTSKRNCLLIISKNSFYLIIEEQNGLSSNKNEIEKCRLYKSAIKPFLIQIYQLKVESYPYDYRDISILTSVINSYSITSPQLKKIQIFSKTFLKFDLGYNLKYFSFYTFYEILDLSLNLLLQTIVPCQYKANLYQHFRKLGLQIIL